MALEPVTRYDEQGRLLAEGANLDGRAHGPWTFYFRDGAVMEAGEYRHGLPVGLWQYFHPDGTLQRRGEYDASGRETGEWSQWHESGDLQAQGCYREGNKHGLWREWNRHGGLQCHGSYLDGRRHGTWTFQADQPGSSYTLEFHQGQATNESGEEAVQPPGHAKHYFPSVPGQLAGSPTPFDPVEEPDLHFARLRGSRRFTYLFRPVRAIEYASGGGLYTVIWERYAWLQFYVRVAVAGPDGVGFDAGGDDGDRFRLFGDPLICRSQTAIGEIQSRRAAIEQAVRVARERAFRVVVGQWIDEFPLDH